MCLLLNNESDTDFNVECATSLQSAQAALKRGNFDVVLLDLDLPDSQGLQTFQAIIAHNNYLPIIVLSSSRDVQTAKNAVRHGAQDYLTKSTLNQDVLRRSILYSIERKHAHFELEETARRLFQAMQEVEYINKAKGEMITRVGREIRSALDSIEGGATLFRSMELDPNHKKYLNFIHKGIDSLYQLLNTTQFAAIQIGDTKIDVFEFNLVDVVEDCLKPLKEAARNKSLELKVDYAADIPKTLLSAPHILKSVLSTLIYNSLDYTTRTTVVVELSSDAPDSVGFQIKDIGSTQLNETESDHFLSNTIQPSECMSLASSKKMCQQLGWELSQSNDNYKCTQFALLVQGEITTNTTDQQADDDPTQHKNTARLYPLKILIAEDSVNSRKIDRAIFNLLGYVPEFVKNGVEAIEACENDNYDLIFMDIDMPEMDGISAANIIREKYTKNRPHIVALTASATESDREKCIESGLDAHIAKPIAIQKLIPIIQQASQHIEPAAEVS